MTIPLELGNLAATLRYGLDLSWNTLSGSLPPHIGILMFLVFVSHNHLYGNIPQSLIDMTSLDHFNFLSVNSLTGKRNLKDKERNWVAMSVGTLVTNKERMLKYIHVKLLVSCMLI
jgi:hypothetical protein